ncbi:disulfide bond formation protein B [Halomarina salina]|uniref:Disulfide bond formation protein B n=1 Tax=Halomarina salina TaxID=1872699 RepID=A0ABD5RJC2_9EURY|nr:disulfide bond formation protein B [Halomarina salina]
MSTGASGGIAGRRSPKQWLAFGTLVAIVATIGSLTFSLGYGYIPCDLCWYQRILMYPLVVVLGVAAYEDRPGVYRTVLPLALVGTTIAAYHSVIQRTGSDVCGFGGGCTAIQWQVPVLGLSIPNLSLLAFVLILGALVGAVRYSASAGSTTSPVSG